MAKKEVTSHPMTRQRRIILSMLSGFLFVVIIGVMLWSRPQKETLQTEVLPLPTQSVQSKEVVSQEKFVYQGSEGVDALTLLKEQTTVEQDRSGLVSSINGRKADPSKREFWSFHVNGKMAEVGPATYITKNGDKIEWRIETY